MTRWFAIIAVFFGGTLGHSGSSFAGSLEPGEAKISGYAFGDYYWVAANHIEDLEDRHGMQFRRIYLGTDFGISETMSARVRFEMNHPGDITSKAKLVPFVKDAYFKWKPNGHQLLVGLSPTPTWSVVEKVWGYRSVEKTPADLFKLGSSRDLGVAVKGKLVDGLLSYHAMFGNGESTSSETERGKMGMLSVGLHPAEGLLIEAYADVEEWGDDGPNRYTFQGFAAYQMEVFRAGVQFVHQRREAADIALSIVSAFAVGKINDTFSVLGRFDRMMDANPGGPKIAWLPIVADAPANFIVVGLDISPHENIKIVPNVEVVMYDKAEGAEEAADPDVIPRLTLYFEFP